MNPDAMSEILLRYLQSARSAVLWKLEGLSEYEVRRPLTATGTNLLGVVKHLAGVEHEYLSSCFGRAMVFPAPWEGDDSPNVDMWATAEESRELVVERYRMAWRADDAAVRELGLDARGTVPWWGEDGKDVTMFRVLVHVLAETSQHAGQMDILRESVDGAAGLSKGWSNLPDFTAQDWAAHVARLEEVAAGFR